MRIERENWSFYESSKKSFKKRPRKMRIERVVLLLGVSAGHAFQEASS